MPQVKEQAYVQAGGWVGSPDVDFREKQVMGTTGGRWRNYLEGSRYQTEDGAYLTEGRLVYHKDKLLSPEMEGLAKLCRLSLCSVIGEPVS